MLNVIVCIKQVPDPNKLDMVKIHPVTKTIIREGIPLVINPVDKNAIEEALRLREKHGGRVVVLSMGPPQAREACREALAMGADEAILLCDRALAGSDTLATAYALAKAIEKIGKFDLVLCGSETVDGSTGQVPPQLAEFLGVPHVTRARKLEIKDGKALVESVIEHGYRLVEVELPAVISVVKEINTPRIVSAFGLVEAASKKLEVWTAKDIGADPSMIGLEGSPTAVVDVFKKEFKRMGIVLKGDPEEVVKQALDKLHELGVL
ncbi:electron transfer flavoprotein subunit beta [Candidatus Geothermarchaeota archaeon ex4572_27]|nr:MAG: electron transfer flavoprotein subunit beta [Candidatus Geothermarchaeota archaeon ex4572_27]